MINVFVWGTEQKQSFKNFQTVLNDKVLTTYDPILPSVLKCDASPVGIGAVLKQNDQSAICIYNVEQS